MAKSTNNNRRPRRSNGNGQARAVNDYQKIRLRRTRGTAPPGSLAEGEPYVEMASLPPRVWMGTPPDINGGRLALLSEDVYLPATGGTVTGPATFEGGVTISGDAESRILYHTVAGYWSLGSNVPGNFTLHHVEGIAENLALAVTPAVFHIVLSELYWHYQRIYIDGDGFLRV